MIFTKFLIWPCIIGIRCRGSHVIQEYWDGPTLYSYNKMHYEYALQDKKKDPTFSMVYTIALHLIKPFLKIAHCLFHKIKILWLASLVLEISFWLIFSNAHLNSRETVPKVCNFKINWSYFYVWMDTSATSLYVPLLQLTLGNNLTHVLPKQINVLVCYILP